MTSTPPFKLLQGNLNHCSGAQDMLLQCLTECSVSLAVVAEPYRVPDHPRWYGDTSRSVAIYWAGTENGPPFSKRHSEQGLVAVDWGPLAVLGCYISPNCNLAEYEEFLDRVADCIRGCLPRPVFVLGDFNAHSRAWGSNSDNARGEAVLDWAAQLDLRLLNRGSVSTCVRWQGESIVDLSWATPSAERMVKGWRVAEELVTLSDHRHITFDVALELPVRNSHRAVGYRRWALGRLDRDMLVAAAHVVDWSEVAVGETEANLEDRAGRLRADMVSICDAAMPQLKSGRRAPAYWWSDHIAGLRKDCLRSRRNYTRARRRRSASTEEKEERYREYRDATVLLQTAIAESKSRSWSGLLDGLDRDPWGRPYKMVMDKLRPRVPPLTETLSPDFVSTVMGNLFPLPPDDPVRQAVLDSPSSAAWSEDLAVTEAEMAQAVQRLAARNTAPGPDGIPGRAWVLALTVLEGRLRRLFTDCLRAGHFPSDWRQAKVVLLHKPGRPMDSPSAYRPICLLNETGKLFERIVAARIGRHLAHNGPDLSDCQYGFRKERSTVHAILRVRELAEQAVSRGRVVLAVSIDIVNAFNSLPWNAIREALAHHRVPPYLQNTVAAYLSDRSVSYPGRYGSVQERRVVCGVPQGSVLGPLLWNLAYDVVLRTELPLGVSMVCYADDTLVLAEGESFERTVRLAEFGVARVVAKIRSIGLCVAPNKTEALWFHGLRPNVEPPCMTVRVGDTVVEVGQHMKYLGLVLDSRWSFDEHFDRLVPRIHKVAGALHRLLPNLGGPREEVRRLYAGVVRSVALYGSPVWAHRLSGCRRRAAKLNAAQRTIAIRVARGYRTISYEAATVLARFPPLDILADMNAEIFFKIRVLRQGTDTQETVKRIRKDASLRALSRWRDRLQEPRGTRQRVVGAILPSFGAWLRRRKRVTYRLTQVLTGHGCFGEYLHRIGREASAQCHHCGDAQDSAQHTLERCPAWQPERRILTQAVGPDLSLEAVVAAMLRSGDAWDEVVSFCDQVMAAKEDAERARELADPARRRRRRGGRRGGRI